MLFANAVPREAPAQGVVITIDWCSAGCYLAMLGYGYIAGSESAVTFMNACLQGCHQT